MINKPILYGNLISEGLVYGSLSNGCRLLKNPSHLSRISTRSLRYSSRSLENTRPLVNLSTKRLFSTNSISLSGHSKWSTIKHDKAKNDMERSKLNTRFSNLIFIAAKEGGSADPSLNVRLASAIETANKSNVPKKIIENALKRVSGTSGSADMSQVAVYEAMGPGGVAVIIQTLTDNKSRTASNVKEAINKSGGSMSPCLYLFHRRGRIDIKDADFDQVFEYASEIGAEDIEQDEDESTISVYTTPQDTSKVAQQLKSKYKISDMTVEYAPNMESAVSTMETTAQEQLERLLNKLNNLDDVTNVYTNCTVS